MACPIPGGNQYWESLAEFTHKYEGVTETGELRVPIAHFQTRREMISDLDETIKQLLIKKGGLGPNEVDISFDMPDREWSASISKPTVNLYLYDIRENHELRNLEWSVDKGNGSLATRKKNPSRINLAYLITVWTNDVGDEHRLLWRVLSTLFRFPILSGELLLGKLASQDYPALTVTAQPDGLFSNPSDFWAALDNEIKPSLNYVVTLPLDLDMAVTAPIVKTKELRFTPPGREAERMVQVTGRLHEAGKPGAGIAHARIVAKEAGMTAETDDSGRFIFAKLPEGKHTFLVQAPGKKPPRQVQLQVPGPSYDLEL